MIVIVTVIHDCEFVMEKTHSPGGRRHPALSSFALALESILNPAFGAPAIFTNLILML